MTQTWVLVADSQRARIFSAKSPVAPLEPVAEFENPELVPEYADRPGRGHSRGGAHRYAFEPRVNPKAESESRFAKFIAEKLTEGRVAGRFAALVLVSAPGFLGQVRSHLDDATEKLLTQQINKDLTSKTSVEIRAALA